MKTRFFYKMWAFVAAMVFCGAGMAGMAPEPQLKIGDPAPAIDAMAWIKGEPVKAFKPGHVYVVEFWATWCGPCNAMMPHLSELQQQHAGKLTVIGVNARESEHSEPQLESVAAFVRKKGGKMAYTVAMDDPAKKTVFDAWMTAGGSYGIPTSFVVDGTGRLVWMGHPLGPNAGAFDKAIEQALAGKSDLEAARVIQAQVNEQTYGRLQGMKVMQPLRDAQQRGDYRAVVVEADRLAVASPQQYGPQVFSTKLTALLHLDEKQGLQYVLAQAQDAQFRSRTGLQDDMSYWSNVASAVGREEGLGQAAYRMALDGLQPLVAGGSEFYYLTLVAQLNDRLGNLPAAIAAQEKAVALASASGEMPREYVKNLEETLKDYRARNGRS